MLVMETKPLKNYLRYDTRHATRDTRVFLFLCATRESKNYDTRHATREFVFFYARHDYKKNYDTRHATRVFI
jgi:hypothetical protein